MEAHHDLIILKGQLAAAHERIAIQQRALDTASGLLILLRRTRACEDAGIEDLITAMTGITAAGIQVA